MALLVAMWGMSSLLTLQDQYRNIILISAGFLALPLVLARHLAFDFKFLMLICLGYAVAGKGFAYVSPIEPIYIGEITLVFCVLGYLMRQIKQLDPFPTGIHGSVFVFMGLAGASLMFRDFEQYEMLAMRDASTAYYGLFFFCTFAMLRAEGTLRAMRKVGGWMLVAWLIFAATNLSCQAAGVAGGLTGVLFKIHPMVTYFYIPHPDILFPLAATLAIICISKILRNKNLFYLFPLALAFFALFEGKAAGLFAFTMTCIALVFFAKRIEIGIFGVVSAVGAALLLTIVYVMEIDVVTEYLDGVDAINTAHQGFTESNSRNTTDWRLNWWGAIWEDTMDDNPVFGAGLGSDISSSFLTGFYSADRATQGLEEGGARYPHNVLFTVIGRLGLVGLFVFGAYLLIVAKTLVDFCRVFLRRDDYLIGDLLFFALFCSGLANAFVQSTYEAPYAAIIHWVALAYIARRLYDHKHGRDRNSGDATNAQSMMNKQEDNQEQMAYSG